MVEGPSPRGGTDAWPRGERTRCGVQGTRTGGRGPCTVLLIADRDGWLLLPHGDTLLAVRLTDAAAADLHRQFGAALAVADVAAEGARRRRETSIIAGQPERNTA